MEMLWGMTANAFRIKAVWTNRLQISEEAKKLTGDKPPMDMIQTAEKYYGLEGYE